MGIRRNFASVLRASLVLIVSFVPYGCCSGCVLAASLAGIAGIREKSPASECIGSASKMHFEGLWFFHCYLGSAGQILQFLTRAFFMSRVFRGATCAHVGKPSKFCGGCGRPSPQPLKSSNSSTSMELGTETQRSQLHRWFVSQWHLMMLGWYWEELWMIIRWYLVPRISTNTVKYGLWLRPWRQSAAPPLQFRSSCTQIQQVGTRESHTFLLSGQLGRQQFIVNVHVFYVLATCVSCDVRVSFLFLQAHSPPSHTCCVLDIKVAICSNTSCLGWAVPGVVMLGAWFSTACSNMFRVRLESVASSRSLGCLKLYLLAADVSSGSLTFDCRCPDACRSSVTTPVFFIFLSSECFTVWEHHIFQVFLSNANSCNSPACFRTYQVRNPHPYNM